MESDLVCMPSEQFTKERLKFARALEYTINRASTINGGKPVDCVIVASEEMLHKVDEALLILGIRLNAIIDEMLPRRSIIFCNEADLDIWKIMPD